MELEKLLEIISELVEDGHGKKKLKIAYQPNYPLESGLNHVYVFEGEDGRDGAVYLCESPYGGNNYAPGVVFEDEMNFIEE